MTEQTQDNNQTAGTAPAVTERKKRGPYGPRKPKEGSAPKPAKAKRQITPQMARQIILRAHQDIMSAYRAQRIFGFQRKPTKAERIYERGMRVIMESFCDCAADGEGDE